MATITVYADTADGYIVSSDASYQEALAGGDTFIATTGDTVLLAGQEFNTNVNEFSVYELFMAFDTSTVPDGDAVDSVDLSMHVFDIQSGFGTTFDAEVRTDQWTEPLDTTDWHNGSALGSVGTLVASETIDSGAPPSGYLTFTSQAAFAGEVNKTGDTRLVVYSSRTRTETEPSDAEFIGFYSADESGTTQDPKIVVDHGPPPVDLSGSASTATSAGGALSVVRGLAGSAATAVSAAGPLSVLRGLSGSAATATSASGYLGTPVDLAGMAPVVVSASGTLEVVEIGRVRTPKRRDPQRTDSVRVELLDQHGNILGQVHPAWDRVPTVEVDVSATIPRRLTGVRLDPSEAGDIDVYSHRLRPVWTQAGRDYPMGLYVWSTADRQRDGWGVSLTSGTLHDLTMALHQPLTESFAADEGATITDRLVALIERYGITDYAISPSDQTSSSPLSWAAGKPGSKALDALTSKLSYVWWFDRHGLLRAELEPDPDVHVPAWWYEEAHVQPGVGESQDPFLTPNTWLVVNESAEQSDVTGTYRLPQTNRASAEQRGFDVVKVVNESGISSTAQADKRARHAADESQTTTEVTIVTTPNPGHDLHDIVAWRGTPYREIGWSLPLDPAGEHSHTLRRRDDAL